MEKKIKNLILVFLIALPLCNISAQGCSDSGFCTMGAFRPDQPDFGKFFIKINSIELTQHLGFTPFNDVIHSTFLDANIGIGKKNFLHVRLPAYTIIEGELGTTRGWGDIFVNYSRSLYSTPSLAVKLTAGAKIVTTAPSNTSEDGLPIPLYRQIAFGSNDVNAGISVSNKNWMFAAGYQKALNQIENDFKHSDWEGHDLESIVVEYDESAGLSRGDDIMLRIERSVRLARFNFYGGPLALWRINNDKVLNENNVLVPVQGSSGLALNLVVGGGFHFNTRMSIRLLNSIRLKDRKANPDGLNRVFISQLAYQLRF